MKNTKRNETKRATNKLNMQKNSRVHSGCRAVEKRALRACTSCNDDDDVSDNAIKV